MTEKKIKGELEQFSYALGMSVAGNLINSGVTTINPEIFLEALKDTFSGDEPKLTVEEANHILENFMAQTGQEQGSENLEKGKQFLAENAKENGVTELPSGLQYKILNEGAGDIPTAKDQVKCHYHGTLIDGTVFDSSVQRGQPAVFPVNGVIKGWVEALQLMSTGSKWRLFIPPSLAYGERGAGGAIGPNATLIFDVELLEIV
ncbi:FKBP-type peptidyl-prolyl cis-trans isomerase [Maribellus maritimus]|uniref:FKBP-type peptidyl-prolyl cis-trans isomerase n=1 Tax=Maribellus maritimus TaxID=2870838 RepID=UPI0021D475FE|nr:FKBP-type peptidyl-prolyl cis-trans isomerase [Maribellus maritimus]MCG6187030.1 FKBP-type peptidyl-prolyl cis-trans isomerase [Maribellus maritimus]